MNVLDRFRLDGRTALVTGGARGLGRVMVEALASAGASVALTARDQDRASAAANEVAEQTGSKVIGLPAEMTDGESIRRMTDEALQAFGKVEILINNAGINIRRPIEKLEVEEFDLVLDTNLKGPWLVCRALAESMKRNGWGRVINLSSMLGEIGLADRTPYCASKGGITLLTRTLALEWARFGINVNAIAPGPFGTEINRPLMDDPALRAAMEAKVPLGRWGEPEELGPVAVFLASEASSFITGATIFVDGGYTVQ